MSKKQLFFLSIIILIKTASMHFSKISLQNKLLIVEILKLVLGWDSEDEIWSRFVFELVWTLSVVHLAMFWNSSPIKDTFANIIGKVTVRRMNTSKTALTQTTNDYASRSTIHGIGYVFDKELCVVERILWLFLVLFSVACAAYFTLNFWSQWRDEQVGKTFFLTNVLTQKMN